MSSVGIFEVVFLVIMIVASTIAFVKAAKSDD